MAAFLTCGLHVFKPRFCCQFEARAGSSLTALYFFVVVKSVKSAGKQTAGLIYDYSLPHLVTENVAFQPEDGYLINIQIICLSQFNNYAQNY